jgi:hypothetical protein
LRLFRVEHEAFEHLPFFQRPLHFPVCEDGPEAGVHKGSRFRTVHVPGCPASSASFVPRNEKSPAQAGLFVDRGAEI